MTKHIGRPVEFTEARREKFCTLVGVGVSRRHAAASVGVAPSTVTRHMAADPLFAEQVRDAENECEIDLLKRVRLQSERSWRAAVWLLERMRPERYARGKAAQAAPSSDAMFDKFLALIDEEVGDASLRERLAGRLDEIALEELTAQEMDHPQPARDDVSRPPSPRRVVPQPPLGTQVRANNPPAVRSADADSSAEALVAEILSRDDQSPRRGREPLDFCNTSPSAHDRRGLSKVGT